MLMITRSEEGDLGCTLKLEGKPLGPWVGRLESWPAGVGSIRSPRVDARLYPAWTSPGRRRHAQFSLVRDCCAKGPRVVACSGFVAEMLHHSKA